MPLLSLPFVSAVFRSLKWVGFTFTHSPCKRKLFRSQFSLSSIFFQAYHIDALPISLPFQVPSLFAVASFNCIHRPPVSFPDVSDDPND